MKTMASELQVLRNERRCGQNSLTGRTAMAFPDFSPESLRVVHRSMSHSQSDLLEIRYTKGKGRGVFARKPIPKGTVIERVPLIIVTWDKIMDSELGNYVYSWTEKTAALAMGYGSLYNHSFHPNAYYEDVGRRTKIFTAYRDIAQGEEVTINYNGDPEDQTNELDFEIVE